MKNMVQTEKEDGTDKLTKKAKFTVVQNSLLTVGLTKAYNITRLLKRLQTIENITRHKKQYSTRQKVAKIFFF